MTRRRYEDDEYLNDDSSDGYDGAEDSDADDDEDGEPTVPCPYCRREIHEDALQCPYCQQYISDVDAPARPKPWWLLLGVGLVIYAMFRWMFG
jgi:hypothetical protein